MATHTAFQENQKLNISITFHMLIHQHKTFNNKIIHLKYKLIIAIL